MPIPVQHNTSQRRFECRVEGMLCVADYRLNDDVMHMTHTEVPPALGGRGIAAALVAAALEYARTAHLKVNPACSYVRLYMQRHPETQSLQA
ncbi:MAG: N-acetyltransferase [Pseudorhodobacter sp.]|nr:N-acetyltransferase [Rhizobacter sp.]